MVKFRKIDVSVLEAVQLKREDNEDGGMVSESEDGGSEDEEAESNGEDCKPTSLGTTELRVDANVNLDSPMLMDLISEKPKVLEGESTTSSSTPVPVCAGPLDSADLDDLFDNF